MNQSIFFRRIQSPIGALLAIAQGEALTGLYLPSDPRGPTPSPDWSEGHALLDRTALELAGYFAGRRTRFTVPIALTGTPFQRAVYAALLEIDYGRTRSYREIAAAIGKPRAMRAVGAANARNPLAIVVPCHRVIGSDGTLTGYAGGMSVKSALLELERATANSSTRRVA